MSETVPLLRRKWFFPAMSVVVAVVIASGIVTGVALSAGPGVAEVAEAEALWGTSPDPAADVDYQKDVIVLEHGALAIEELRDEGLTWRLKNDYPGVDRIRSGSVLFLTSRVVGRVGLVERPAAGAVDVTLVPVDVPEVLRNAEFAVDEALSAEDFVLRETDEYPGMISDSLVGGEAPDPVMPDAVTPEASGGGGLRTASVVGAQQQASACDEEDDDGEAENKRDGAKDDKDSRKVGASFCGLKLGPFTVAVSTSDTKLDLKAFIIQAGLKAELSAALSYRELKIASQAKISSGRWENSPTMTITGLERLDLGYIGASAKGLADNVKFQIDVPLEVSKQVLVQGVPLVLKAKLKFSLGTGFSASNASLTGRGSYALAGPLGIRDGDLVVPSFTVIQPIVDTIAGVSLGIDSAIVGVSARFTLGFGLEAVSMGPYASLTATVGLLRGSQLTSPWGVPCQATLVVSAGGGLSGSAKLPYLQALQKRLRMKSPPELEFDALVKTKEFVNRTAQLPACINLLAGTAAPTETPPVERQQRGNDPFTASGAPSRPGPGGLAAPPPDKPVTRGVENPDAPNSDLGDDGSPSGPEPGPRRPAEDPYTLETEYCDVAPDARDPRPDVYGNPTNFFCPDWQPPEPAPNDENATDEGKI